MNFDVSTVTQLLDLCRKNGVSRFKLGELEAEFGLALEDSELTQDTPEEYKPSKDDPLSMQMWTEEMTNG